MGMAAFAPEQYARIMELQQQKKTLLQEFHGLAQLQQEIIEREDTTALQGNLNRRQELITQVDTLHQELDLLMQSYPPIRQQLGESHPQVAALTALQNEIQDILRQIAALDTQNQARAARQLQHFRDEIKRLSLGRKTLQSYSQGAVSLGSELFDKKT